MTRNQASDTPSERSSGIPRPVSPGAQCFDFVSTLLGTDARDSQRSPARAPKKMEAPYGEDKKGRPRSLLLFDGTCLLCHGSVQFVMKYDVEDRFVFMPLQSTRGQAVQRACGFEPQLDGVVLIDPPFEGTEKNFSMKSGAATRVLMRLQQPLATLGLLGFCVPYPIRDAVYFVVAKSRYTVFGTTDECMMPSAKVLTGEEKGSLKARLSAK